jgi:hypothetical protein
MLATGVAFSLGQVAPARAETIKAGSFVKTTAGAPVTQAVPHGLGTTPKALILWTNGKTNASASGGAFYGFGASDGTTSASVAAGLRDASAVAYAGSRYASGSVLVIVDGGGGATLAQAALSSWNTTTFTLNWTTNNASPYLVHFIADRRDDVWPGSSNGTEPGLGPVRHRCRLQTRRRHPR